MDNCTMLVSSYDGGEDLWDGFFTSVKHQWKNFDMPIVLNTESKSYSYEGFDIKTFQFYKPGQKVAWAKRLIRTLKAIKTDYILLFLEDFWLEDAVDTEFFEKCLQWMKDNPDVAVLSFKPVSTFGPNIRDNRFERFERRPQKGRYRFNCQVAIWRRKKLIKYLRPHESPWDWELAGSIRSSRYKESFYTLIKGEKEVFPYDMGWVVFRGRWTRRAALPLAEKYNLDIDFTKRGFYEDYEKEQSEASPEQAAPETLFGKVKTLWKVLKRKYHTFKSLI